MLASLALSSFGCVALGIDPFNFDYWAKFGSSLSRPSPLRGSFEHPPTLPFPGTPPQVVSLGEPSVLIFEYNPQAQAPASDRCGHHGLNTMATLSRRE